MKVPKLPKLSRPLLIKTTVVVVVLAAVMAVPFLPAVQTWVAHRVLAGHPGLNIDIGRVAAGLNHVELDNVRITQSDGVLTLPVAEVDLPLISTAGKKVFIRKLVAKGWTLDLTVPGGKPKPAQTAAAPAAAAAAAFQGIFQQLHLPMDLAIDSAELSGDVIFSADSGQPSAHAHVTLTGGGLAAGHEGKFDFEINAAPAGLAAAMGSLALHGVIVATLDKPRTFSHLGLVADGAASGLVFPQGARVHVVIDALRSAADENYAIALDTNGKHLFALNADYPANSPTLTGGWQLNMRDTDLAPFTLGFTLPVFEAAGDGKFETDAALKGVRATGHLQVSAGRLEAVRAGLQILGRLTLETHFDLTRNAGVTRVDQFDATVTGEHPVAEVHTLQSFEFNTKTIELKVADPAKDLFSFALQGLPLAWVQPFFSGFAVDGSDATGTLLFHARNGGMHFQSLTPLEAKNLSVARAGQPLARLDRAALKLSGDCTLQQGWQVELTASAQSGQKTLFTLQTKAGAMAGLAQPIKATGQFEADLPAVLAQPAFASSARLTGGNARVDFQASLDEKKEIEAKLALTGLASPQAPSLPAVTADVRAELAGGQITFNAPLLFVNAGRTSDLAFSGTFQSVAGARNIDAHIAGNFIVVDDLRVFASLRAVKPVLPPPSPAPPAAAPVTPPRPDLAPFWKGVTGHLVLALKKVVYGQFEVNDVAGEFKIGSGALAFDRLGAVMDSGCAAGLSGAINFSAGAPEPYSFKANVKIDQVDSGPIFRAHDPSKPPTFEGKFDGTGQLTGSGLNLVDLARRAQGEATLTSKSGISRLFAKSAPAQNAAGSPGAEKSTELSALDKITIALQKVPYDQIDVQLSRSQSLDVQVKNFSMISQKLRVMGTGAIAYDKDKSILDQKLALRLQLGVQGDFEPLFGAVHKLSSRKDELGYTQVSRPIKIGGTTTDANTDAFYHFLGEGLAARLLDHIMNIFGGDK